jgi:hypothetical protein
MVNVEADWAAVLAAATAVARTKDPKPKQERRREKIARVAIVLNELPKSYTPRDRACQPKPMQRSKTPDRLFG